uniref:Uncharacterized protein n=1 Tax=Triticum urartu TaxID=4572 RepID=A0A8R7UMN5_TRIUA
RYITLRNQDIRGTLPVSHVHATRHTTRLTGTRHAALHVSTLTRIHTVEPSAPSLLAVGCLLGRGIVAFFLDPGGDHGGLVVRGLEQEAAALVVHGDLERLAAEAVGDGEHDAAHLAAELGAVDGAAVVGVELLEDGVVEGGHLGGERGRLGGAEARAVEEEEGLERAAELGAGEHAVAVGVERGEARVHAAREGRLVRHEGPHRRPVQDHHAHLVVGRTPAPRSRSRSPRQLWSWLVEDLLEGGVEWRLPTADLI